MPSDPIEEEIKRLAQLGGSWNTWPEPERDLRALVRRVREEATEAAVQVLEESARRLTDGKRRVNQVDAHVADVLETKAAAIRALSTGGGADGTGGRER